MHITHTLLLLATFLVSSLTLNAQQANPDSKSFHEDMTILKSFFKKSERKGLYKHLKKLKRPEKQKIIALHEKYDIPTTYMADSEALLSKTKTTWKERRTNRKESSWKLTDLRSFLIKNQVIKYIPKKGARIDGRGVRVAF